MSEAKPANGSAAPQQSNGQDSKPCSRCSKTDIETYILRKDLFCGPCLQAWLLSRIAKRMHNGFRVVGGSRDDICTVLLPLSGGISSLSLLHLLHVQVSSRLERTGRAGYEIIGLWVDHRSLGFDDGFTPEGWELLKQRYGQRWRFETVAIEDVFSATSGLLDDHERASLLGSLSVEPTNQDKPPLSTLTTLLTSLPEPSSRTDLLTSLRNRLITSFAQRNACSVIVWGDSTTRLAEKTLAETAKGRGFSLPWQTGDGETPFHGIKYMYPLQDLHRREIALWARVASEPALSDIVALTEDIRTSGGNALPGAVSSKNLTIDELMKRYFAGVEEAYPSVVANVVRTSNKLARPAETAAGLVTCGICGLAFDSQAGDLLAWEGNQSEQLNGHAEDDKEVQVNGHREGGGNAELCYACYRTMHKARRVRPG